MTQVQRTKGIDTCYMTLLCGCTGCLQVEISDMDAVKVLARSPKTLVPIIVCLVVVIAMCWMMMSVHTRRRQRSRRIVPHGNDIVYAPKYC